MKYLLSFLLFSAMVFAQQKGEVFDAETNQPIPYVNIWVEGEEIGTTSEENGSFTLNITEEKNIVFSALGYETKTVSSTEISKVYLQPQTIQLNELVLEKPKRSKTLKIDSYKKANIKVFSGAGTQPTIIAKKIEFSKKIDKHPFIKELKFNSLCQIEKAKIILRFFNVDNEGKPGYDYLDENIIIEVKKGKNNNKINLEAYNIKIPKEGLFIAFEWMIIEENKHEYTGEYTNEKGDVEKIEKMVNYQPFIGAVPSESKPNWQYSKGKWFKREKLSKVIKNEKYMDKFGELAIEIILTN